MLVSECTKQQKLSQTLENERQTLLEGSVQSEAYKQSIQESIDTKQHQLDEAHIQLDQRENELEAFKQELATSNERIASLRNDLLLLNEKVKCLCSLFVYQLTFAESNSHH